MEWIKYIDEACIIIVPQTIKEKILLNLSKEEKLINYKIITDSQLKEILTFSYDKKTIVYLVDKYELKPSVAKEYLTNLYFVDEKKLYRSNKLNKMVEIKNDLLKSNLIKNNNSEIFTNKKIYIYGFDVISKEQKQLFSKLKNVNYIPTSAQKNNIYGVYEFYNLKDEVNFVLRKISSLINEGVDINKIFIANANQDYMFYLTEYAKMYNMPVLFKEKENLYNLFLTKEFLSYLNENDDYKLAFDKIALKYQNNENLSILLNIVNKYVDIPYKNARNILIEELKETSVKQKKYQNTIKLISLENMIFEEDEHIFVMSLNQTIFPKTFKNEDFYNDLEKEELNIDTTLDLNRMEKEKFKIMLNKKGNFYLSYKLKSAFANFTKSFIIEESNLEVKHYEIDNTFSYSETKDKLDLACIYDEIYQEVNDINVAILNNSYNIPYRSYNNAYTKINPLKIQKYLQDKNINLSYSSLNNYYQCGFKYYLSNILKIGNYKPTSATEIGNLFHEVLQHYQTENFDFDLFFEEKFNNLKEPTTRFYAQKLKETLLKICKINQENLSYTKLSNILCEKKVEVIYNHPITIKFKGFIDKMMYLIEDDKTYVAIIDYKTGNTDIDLEKVQFGLSLQLPIYLYLLKHTDQFKNVIITGFYLQKLLNESSKAGEDEYESLKKRIKLQGYSNSDLTILSKFDSSYEKSEVIQSMSITKKGLFNYYAKTLSSEEMDKLTNTVEEKVIEAINKICNAEFDISPKIYNKKNLSCEFCEFKNCCYVSAKDYIYLTDVDNAEYDEGVDD